MRYHLLVLSLSLGYILADECFQENVKIKGSLLTKKKTTEDSAEDCLALCEASEGCVAVLYVTENHKKKKLRKMCSMYKNVKKVVKSKKPKKKSMTIGAILEKCVDTVLGKICPIEEGFCVDSNGEDQNAGVEKLYSVEGASEEDKAACLSSCQAQEGATGCEFIYNFGCFVHTQEVVRGNGVKNHACWVFDRCRGQNETIELSLQTNWGSLDTLSVVTKDIFAIWWDPVFDHSADVDSILERLIFIRNDCLNNLGLQDPPNPGRGFFFNVYIHHDHEGTQDLFPNGWAHGIGTDPYRLPFYTLPVGSIYENSVYHEGFHIFQYNRNSPGFDYSGDTQWFIESSAQWYKASYFPQSADSYVEAGAIIGNPQLSLWHSFANEAPGDPNAHDGRAGWMYGVRQYGMQTLLMFLTEVKGVDRSFITNGFNAKTELSPQEYLFTKIGPDTFRSHFADWAAHNTAGLDYLTTEQIERAYNSVGLAGDWSLFRPSVWWGQDSGTNGIWVEPDESLRVRGWAYNVFNITNTLDTTYTFQLEGQAEGSQGARAFFVGRVVVVNKNNGSRFYGMVMSNALQGEVTVNVTSEDSQVFLIVASVPEYFESYQHYLYKVNISVGE